MPRQMSSIQGKQSYLMLHYNCSRSPLVSSQQHSFCLVCRELEEQAGPSICLLAPHLQLEWDLEANAHLGSIIIAPQSNKKAWFRSGMCKAGQPHRWQASIQHRTNGSNCPCDAGRAACPCNDLAHNHPEVAAEWDWEANGGRSPETVTASTSVKATWRCGLCGHIWSANISNRTSLGRGCLRCGREASRIQSRQASISSGAPHLLAEWDWEANKGCSWYPDQITLGSNNKVHWVVQDECKLGLVHRWQATPHSRAQLNCGFPLPVRQSCVCLQLPGCAVPRGSKLLGLPTKQRPDSQ